MCRWIEVKLTKPQTYEATTVDWDEEVSIFTITAKDNFEALDSIKAQIRVGEKLIRVINVETGDILYCDL